MENTLPPLAAFAEPEAYSASFLGFNFESDEALKIKALLTSIEPLSIRDIGTLLSFNRTEMTSLMAEAGFGQKPEGRSQWRAKPGYHHCFRFHQSKGYQISPDGLKELAKTLHARLSRAKTPKPVSYGHTVPVSARIRAMLPPRPDLFEEFAKTNPTNFEAHAAVIAYVRAYEQLQYILDKLSGAVSDALPIDKLHKLLDIPSHLKDVTYETFISRYYRLTNGGRAKVAQPGYEKLFTTADNGYIRGVTPTAVFTIAAEWEKHVKHILHRERLQDFELTKKKTPEQLALERQAEEEAGDLTATPAGESFLGTAKPKEKTQEELADEEAEDWLAKQPKKPSTNLADIEKEMNEALKWRNPTAQELNMDGLNFEEENRKRDEWDREEEERMRKEREGK